MKNTILTISIIAAIFFASMYFFERQDSTFSKQYQEQLQKDIDNLTVKLDSISVSIDNQKQSLNDLTIEYQNLPKLSDKLTIIQQKYENDNNVIANMSDSIAVQHFSEWLGQLTKLTK